MTRDHARTRRAFARPAYLFVRVAPEGFVVLDEVRDELTGRIVKSHLVRKLFDDCVLACWSKDGVTAQGDRACEECRHPRCQAGLRIHLRDGPVVYVLDLAVSAAKDCLDLLDAIASEDQTPEDVPLRLNVLDRGKWGLVRFKRR